jgi:hypothetical protein
MDLFDKIDNVLKYLYKNSGNNPTLREIETGVKKVGEINIGEVRDILLKLKEDKMVYCEYLGNLNHEYNDNGKFLITFKGKFFYETVGSFRKQATNDALAESQKGNRELMLIRGTWAAGIAGALLFLMEVVKFV